jgi:rhodanese-related sulfurtransferase
MKTATIHELKAQLDHGACLNLVDVRTPAEYAAVHLPGARLHQLDRLDCATVLALLAQRSGSEQEPIYLLCHSGARAKRAAEQFAAAGFHDCVVVEGGTQAWVEAGYPAERGEGQVLPLDRQLQLAIGTIVLSGVLLSRLVDPRWIWLSGFAGAGLIFAGSTGICVLRSLIAVMPWNQKSRRGGGSCCGTRVNYP